MYIEIFSFCLKGYSETLIYFCNIFKAFTESRCFHVFDSRIYFDHTFWPIRHILFCPVFTFRRNIFNTNGNLVLHLQREELNISSMYNFISVINNGICNIVFYSVISREPVCLCKVRWIEKRSWRKI